MKNDSSNNNTQINKPKKRLRKINKSRKVSCHNRYVKNPSITRFQENSLFIYDNDMADEYLLSVKNKKSN